MDVDNIQVLVRARPFNDREKREGTRTCLSVDPHHKRIVLQRGDEQEHVYTFDQTMDERSTQEELFQSVGRPIAENCLKGYNGCIFAYGQTGSGKTYSIQGGSGRNEEERHRLRGILPRVLEYIFAMIERTESNSCGRTTFLVKCSLLEVYKENLTDLFCPASAMPLVLREDVKKGVYVEGQTEFTVQSASEALTRLYDGLQHRKTGSTLMNSESSRSHSIFTIQIQCKETTPDGIVMRHSRLNVVDLAGSERQKSTQAVGQQLREASAINKSLTTLGHVIRSLVDLGKGKHTHVHYRDSKLTYLLKDSLGGNSKTCIIAAVGPTEMCYSETLSTLQFASRAKRIQNKAVINHDEHTQQLMKLQREVVFYKKLAAENGHDVGGFSMDGISGIANHASNEALESALATSLRHEKTLNDEIEKLRAQNEKLEDVCNSQSKQLQEKKMLLKMRTAFVAKLQRGDSVPQSDEVACLQQEIQALKADRRDSELEVENMRLKAQLDAMKSTTAGDVQRHEREIAELRRARSALATEVVQLVHKKNGVSPMTPSGSLYAFSPCTPIGQSPYSSSLTPSSFGSPASDYPTPSPRILRQGNMELEKWRIEKQFEQQVEELQTKIDEQQMAHLKEITALQKTKMLLEAEQAASQQLMDEQEHSLESLSVSLDVAQQEKQHLRDHASKLLVELKGLQEQLDIIYGEAEYREKQMNDKTAAYGDVVAQLRAAEEELSAAEGREELLREQMESLSSALESNSAVDKEGLETRIATLIKENGEAAWARKQAEASLEAALAQENDARSALIEMQQKAAKQAAEHESRIEELQATIATQTRELKQVNSAVHALEAQLESEAMQRDELLSMQEESAQQIQRLEQEKTQLESEIREMDAAHETEVREIMEQLNNEHEALVLARQDLVEAERDLIATRAQLEEAKARGKEVEMLQERVRELEEIVAARDAAVARAESNAEEKATECTQLLMTVAQLESSIATETDRVGQLKEELHKQRQSASEERERLVLELAHADETLQQHVAEQTKEITSLESKLEVAETTLERLPIAEANVQRLEKELSAAVSERDAVKTELEECEQKLSKLSTLSAEWERARIAKKAEIEKLLCNKKELEAHVHELVLECTQHREELDSRQEEIHRLTEANDEIEFKLHSTDCDLQALKEDYAQQESACRHNLTLLSEAQEELECMRDRETLLKEQIDTLEEQERAAVEELGTIRAERETLAEQNTRLEIETEELRVRVHELSTANAKLIGHSNHKQKIQHHLKIKKENDQLKKELDDLHKEIAKLRTARGGVRTRSSSRGALAADAKENKAF